MMAPANKMKDPKSLKNAGGLSVDQSQLVASDKGGEAALRVTGAKDAL